jgi:hypothetical protein
VANHLIFVEGDTAKSVTYIAVVLWTNPDVNGQQQEIVAKGRYLDQWSKRKEKWAITHREHILDMQTFSELNRVYVNTVSARDVSDPSFKIIPKS